MRIFNWLKPEQPELSEENKTKVCIITDMNKAQKLLLGRNMNTVEFDYLYDQDQETLNTILFQMKLRIEHERILSALSER